MQGGAQLQQPNERLLCVSFILLRGTDFFAWSMPYHVDEVCIAVHIGILYTSCTKYVIRDTGIFTG